MLHKSTVLTLKDHSVAATNIVTPDVSAVINVTANLYRATSGATPQKPHPTTQTTINQNGFQSLIETIQRKT